MSRRRLIMAAKKPPAPVLPYLCFTAEEANSTVGTAIVGTVSPRPVLEYSTDGVSWSNFARGTVVTLPNVGDRMYLRGDNSSFSTGPYDYIKFVMSGKIAASGNVMSLVDKSCESVTIPNDYCYYRMFEDCTSLTTAPELPATTLASHCYRSMFEDCTSLTTAPELPVTTLASYCYSAMFYNCTSLTTAPELPATTLAKSCYSSMFSNCTSLTTAPELPATTLADGCYAYMFSNCTSLYVSNTSGAGYDKAWDIPSEGVASGDYTFSDMFRYCRGARSTHSPNFNGTQKTYYTQNVPV